MRLQPKISIVFLLALITPAASPAQWQPGGVPVCTAPDDQIFPEIIPDGSGGAIMTWVDFRNGVNYDIYAQRIDASGTVLWTAGGVPICTSANNQGDPTIVSDGAGGAVIIWYDQRSGPALDIWAQRINASGVVQWIPNGVPVCTAPGDQSGQAAVADGSGGVIVTWTDDRYDFYGDLYAQRIDPDGGTSWLFNGVVVCDSTQTQRFAGIISDGSGGAIIAWEDARSNIRLDVYAQRVDASGTVLWTAGGVALSTADYDQSNVALVSDGSGGAIVAWEDKRTEVSVPDIYAQRVDASGAPQWDADGIVVCAAYNGQSSVAITGDGAGGAIIAWQDERTLVNYDVYAQRVTSYGTPLWPSDGVVVSGGDGNQSYPLLVPDGAGGALVTFTYHLSQSGTSGDIHAQRLDGSGAMQWDTTGVVVCDAVGTQTDFVVAEDGSDGIIVAWRDGRSGDEQLYAQRIEARYGCWGHPEAAVTSVADVPADQGGAVKVNWTASGLDVLDYRQITHYSVWRATDPVAAAGAIAKNPSLVVSPSAVIDGFSRPAWRVERIGAVDYYWELVGTQTAQYFAGYAYSAATTADSTAQGAMEHFFQVLAHTEDPWVFWPSNALSGHSVDNLAPAPPLQLTAERVGSDVYLTWNSVDAVDLRDYAVYRATAPGVTPVPVNFLLSSTDTVTVDTGPPAGALYYVVTAVDVHDNQSAPSNEASVTGATGARTPPSIAALTVPQNRPNPFTGSTELEIGLPSPSPVTIELFDVAGRRVRLVELPEDGAGWRRFSLAGVDDAGGRLASGVYFCRVSANGAAVTQKMVIAR